MPMWQPHSGTTQHSHADIPQIATWYTLVIYTASMPEYADPVIDWLDAGRSLFAKRLYRDSCFLQSNGSYIKDLALVEKDLSRVCFMDNSPVSYAWNKGESLLSWLVWFGPDLGVWGATWMSILAVGGCRIGGRCRVEGTESRSDNVGARSWRRSLNNVVREHRRCINGQELTVQQTPYPSKAGHPTHMTKHCCRACLCWTVCGL